METALGREAKKASWSSEVRMGPVRASPAGGVLGSRPACALKGLLFLYKMAVMIIALQRAVFQLLRVLSRDMAVVS